MSEVSLVDILGLRSRCPDIETENATLYVHVPWVGSAAYLHTIFRAAEPLVLEHAASRLAMPLKWRSILEVQNGFNLFLNSLYVYGVAEPGSLRTRDPRKRAPFSIEELNKDAGFSSRDEWLLVGSYGYGGSRVFVSRVDSSIRVLEQSGERTLATSSGPSEWLRDEVRRLSMLFSPDGRLRTDERFTDPQHSTASV